jgi:hypothetical protein
VRVEEGESFDGEESKFTPLTFLRFHVSHRMIGWVDKNRRIFEGLGMGMEHMIQRRTMSSDNDFCREFFNTMTGLLVGMFVYEVHISIHSPLTSSTLDSFHRHNRHMLYHMCLVFLDRLG